MANLQTLPINKLTLMKSTKNEKHGKYTSSSKEDNLYIKNKEK